MQHLCDGSGYICRQDIHLGVIYKASSSLAPLWNFLEVLEWDVGKGFIVLWPDAGARYRGKKVSGVTSFIGVLLKPDFVSATYTRLGYIHSAFKRGREISNSLALSEIKKSMQINTATPS